MGKERVLAVLNLETREFKKYRSGKEFLEENPSFTKSRYGGAKFHQQSTGGLFFCLVDQMDFVLENIEEIIQTGKLSKKLPKEKSPYNQPLYIYDADTGEWTFYKTANYAQKILGSPTAPTLVRYADMGEWYYDKLRILWWEGDATVKLSDTVVAPEGILPKPKNKEEEMERRKLFGMFPFGKYAEYYDNGVLNRPKWNAMLRKCEEISELESESDGRRLYGLSRRQRVAGYWLSSMECCGVWPSMQHAREETGVGNMHKIITGQVAGSFYKDLTFRKLDKDEPDPIVTKPYKKEQEEDEFNEELELELIEDIDE